MACNGHTSEANRNENKLDSGVVYSEYLNLDQLLTCQKLLSLNERPAHHEHLFIIIHQVYELWFKQIVFELDSVREFFSSKAIKDLPTLEIIKRLNRILVIFKLLTDQISILETMTPNDFNEFRDLLCPASGFQSLQFRLIENKLGLKQECRNNFHQQYRSQCKIPKSPDLVTMELSKIEPSLFCLVQQWLENVSNEHVQIAAFWLKYKQAVNQYLQDQQNSLTKKTEGSIVHEYHKANFEKMKAIFETLFDEEKYSALIDHNEQKFSLKAMQGAIIIVLYRNNKYFSQYYQILVLLIEMDMSLIKWRYNHMLMVQRMIGSQSIGTGGSSGYYYLRSTLSDHYKIFIDLINLSAFLIPENYVPTLSSILHEKDPEYTASRNDNGCSSSSNNGNY